MERSEWWWEGYRAYQMEYTGDNPYYVDDQGHQDWEDGWQQAAQDD